jgi:hypothetical protein
LLFFALFLEIVGAEDAPASRERTKVLAAKGAAIALAVIKERLFITAFVCFPFTALLTTQANSVHGQPLKGIHDA